MTRHNYWISLGGFWGIIVTRLRTIAALFSILVSLSSCTLTESSARGAREWREPSLNIEGNVLIERTCAERQEEMQEANLPDLSYETTCRGSGVARVRITIVAQHIVGCHG